MSKHGGLQLARYLHLRSSEALARQPAIERKLVAVVQEPDFVTPEVGLARLDRSVRSDRSELLDGEFHGLSKSVKASIGQELARPSPSASIEKLCLSEIIHRAG